MKKIVLSLALVVASSTAFATQMFVHANPSISFANIVPANQYVMVDITAKLSKNFITTASATFPGLGKYLTPKTIDTMGLASKDFLALKFIQESKQKDQKSLFLNFKAYNYETGQTYFTCSNTVNIDLNTQWNSNLVFNLNSVNPVNCSVTVQ